MFEGYFELGETSGRQRFIELVQRTHLLIMPSTAEAFGLVNLEAAAHGVPSIAMHTCGVPSAMIDGASGRLLDPDSSAEAHADTIETITRDPSASRRMALSTYETYRTTFHVDPITTQLQSHLERAVSAR